jgi:YD repeat-containing protein
MMLSTDRGISDAKKQLLGWLLLFPTVCAATGQNYQWAGNFGSSFTYEDSASAAAADIQAYCNANPVLSGSCNTPIPCGGAYTCTFTATAVPYFSSGGANGYPYYIANIHGVASDGVSTPINGDGTFGISTKRINQPFLSTAASGPAQCGCNSVGHPIIPASGGVISKESAFADSANAPIPFDYYYNGAQTTSSALGATWRHSYSRSIVNRYAGTANQVYVSSPANSSLYNDETSACTSGFSEIQSRVSTWAALTSSYSNGTCSLYSGTTRVGTITVYYNNALPPPPPTSSSVTIGLEAVRDDGLSVTFIPNGSAYSAPMGVAMVLQPIAGGYTLTDEQDNVETYDSTGKLQSVKTRAGVIKTMTYDGSGRLSTVVDSFGHTLTLGYDAQGRLSSVTQ